MAEFMFATGIECSCPTIEGGRWRIDELEATDHYRYWRRDLELVRDLGLRYLRYGPPLHRIFIGPGKFDWSFMDQVAESMQQVELVPIADLCHFGVPDWLENFQNPELPERLAEYAGAFARRYSWIQHYTPVNEMYVAARMSALDGVWNEQLRSETAFVTAIRHLARASLLMMSAILRESPGAKFINSESSEFYQPCCPDPEILRIADFENQRRFIALDLLYAVPVRKDVYAYLLDHGMPAEEYDWFMGSTISERAILGVDYYKWNEKVINSQGRPEALGELFGWYVITSQYYDRYRRPVMHTETNCPDAADGPGWLWRQWHNVQLVHQAGVPVTGFTWYSLQDQVDWDIGLSRAVGNVNPVGLFDLNRDPRPVADAYRYLIDMYKDNPFPVRATAGAGS
jgi:beta-glucosidase/6-phospho-beta-glucosidase/beta-galactosidase